MINLLKRNNKILIKNFGTSSVEIHHQPSYIKEITGIDKFGVLTLNKPIESLLSIFIR